MTDECTFCRITQGKTPADIVYQDERITAFRDIHPVAPTHVLIIPNRHMISLNDLEPGDESLMGHLIVTAQKLAVQKGVAETGYRLILNTGPHGRQVVKHLHLHLIGGQPMRHPIG